MNPEDYIREAMKEADQAVLEGNTPFGVVVTDPQGQIIWRDHDRVKELTDPTAHGEINAIRSLCQKLKTLSLKNYTFYTTSEPCPTCLTACIKAKIKEIYYGAPTEPDASLPIPATELATRSQKFPIKVSGGILEHECLVQRNNYEAK